MVDKPVTTDMHKKADDVIEEWYASSNVIRVEKLKIFLSNALEQVRNDALDQAAYIARKGIGENAKQQILADIISERILILKEGAK